MLSVAVDPHLLALPNPCNSVEELENFVNGLLAWAEAIDRPNLKILISEICVQALIDDGLYPYDHEFNNLWHTHLTKSEIAADLNTVRGVLKRLLDQTPSLEEELEISYLIYEENTVSITPEYFLNRLSPNTLQASQVSLIMLGVWNQYSRKHPEFSGCIFAAGLIGNTQQDELVVKAEVALIEPYSSNTPYAYELPSLVDTSFHVCFGHVDVLQQVGCSSLWGNADSEQSAVDAIQLRVDELIREGTTDVKAVRTFKLGSKFLKSARRWGFTCSGSAMILIDSCARIVIGMPRKELKPFRINKDSTEQRVRSSDQALAWRNHLTKGGPGFRLMYWETSTGEIEFANVGDKDELIISE